MAGRYPSEWIDDVRDRSDIVSVISEYMTLTKKGSKYWGLCPFHGEKTPSFSVDSEKQMYYCFGCHVGGNVVTFLMNQEHMEFTEAIEHLAEKAHIPIPEKKGFSDESPKRDKDRLYAALTAAAKFYNKTLYTEEGAASLEYLHNRGIRDNVIRHFGLGSTAKGWTSLYDALTQEGFTKEELIDCNLVLERGGKLFDAFRDRVMFPIFDPRGRVIAFGGRVLGDGQPKYLNSSDTPVFNKRRNCYGLNFLKGGKREFIRLVEGYMDVVSLYQHGVDGCIATLGTALTNEQIRLMKRYAPQIIITYDGDGAGQRAIQRGLDLFEQENVPARVTVVPDKMDPDEYVRAKGGDALGELGSIDPTTYRLNVLADSHDLSKEEERSKYAIEAAQVLRRLDNPVEIQRFIKRLTLETGFDEETLNEQVGRHRAAPAKTEPQVDLRTYSGGTGTKPDDAYVKAQKELISMLASGIPVPKDILKEDDFADPHCKAMAQVLLSGGGLNGLQNLMDNTEDVELKNTISSVSMIDRQYDKDTQVKLMMDCITQLRIQRINQQINELTEEAKVSPNLDTLSSITRLTNQKNELMKKYH